MKTCDVCTHQEPLTERTSQQGKREDLCGDCYRWSDYWDSLTPKEQSNIYLAAS